MNLENYQSWLSIARKFSKRQDEAEDLLQDSLLIAYQQDKLDFSKEQHRKWFTGVLKHRAAMMARSQSRRKRREQINAVSDKPLSTVSDSFSQDNLNSQLLMELNPASRKVMALILSGLNREEVCSALNLSDVALRQRLTTIRKALRHLPEDLQHQALALAYQRNQERADDLAFGLIRRALFKVLSQGFDLGTHDPDGHLFIIKSPE